MIYFNYDHEINYFNPNDQPPLCGGQNYLDFLDYAFSRTDYFMLVYTNYHGKGYSTRQKNIKNH